MFGFEELFDEEDGFFLSEELLLELCSDFSLFSTAEPLFPPPDTGSSRSRRRGNRRRQSAGQEPRYRLTVTAIYRLSSDRDEAVRLLARNGYVTDRPLADVADLAR